VTDFREAILVVGHGSRREEANTDVREVARRIGERGGFPLVVAAFLEIATPNIDEGIAQLVEAGANHIIVHPYFLSPGRHTRGDIPVEVAKAVNRHPHLSYQITEPLAAHSLVIGASIERIRETQARGPAECLPDEQICSGKVYLVGAGPGDPGLLTVKALELLRRADVVIYDYLVNPDLLVNIREDAERIYAGKVGGGRQTPQDEINSLLIDRARRGKIVVRLKGGDPFLYGRGGEEGQMLHEAGISFELVPGVSSALAVPAYAGIPLTHRGLSRSVAIITGTHASNDDLSLQLSRVAGADTIVVLMGLSQLRRISEELITAGRAPETPAAVIRWGSYESQQTISGTLDKIADDVEREGLRAPVVIVIGEVVRLRDELNWFEKNLVGVSEIGLANEVYVAN
jgi:uroporphyrin-III C-methyltransferase